MKNVKVTTQTEQLLQRGSDLTELLLPAIFNIFGLWCLTDVQQMNLLGLGDKKILHNWMNNPEQVELSEGQLKRVSYILGIYKSLQVLFPDPVLADQWLSTPNDNPLFNSKTPMDRLLLGHVEGLATVRAHLDYQLGG